MERYKVAVVGLGMVGMMYDHISTPNKTIYSHSKAFSIKSNVFDVYGVDPNIEALNIFEKNGYGRGFTSINQVFELGIDIYVLAIETSIHYKIACEIMNLCPKILLVEKPISYTIQESRNLVSNFEHNGTSVFVNYFRRSLPKINSLKELVKLDQFKKCSCYIFYSGGLFNIASHFIDLLNYLFGDLVLVRAKIKRKLGSDFLVDFILKNEFMDATFVPVDVSYKFFEMAIFFDDIKVTIDTFGNMNFFRKGSHIVLNIDHYLVNDRVIDYDIYTPQKYVVDNICQYLNTGSANLCSGREALITEELINQIIMDA